MAKAAPKRVAKWELRIPPSIGKILRAAREKEERDWSLKEAVDRLHVSKPDSTINASTLHRYERGEVSPQFDKFMDLAELYEINVAEAFEECLRSEYEQTCQRSTSVRFEDTEFGQVATAMLKLLQLSQAKRREVQEVT